MACRIVPIGLPQTRRLTSREEDRDRDRGGDVSTRVNIDDNKTYLKRILGIRWET